MKLKDTLITILKSSLIGVACIVPGVSGGTLAVILGLYDKILFSISNLRKDFKNSIKFLWPIVLGIAIGLGATIYPIKLAFQHFPLPTIVFFVGLILGSLPSLCKNIRRKPNVSGIFSIILALVAVIGMSFLGSGNSVDLSSSMSWYNYIILFIVGIVGSCALVIPGISGSALLLILGFWEPILICFTELIKFNNFGHNFLVLFLFGVGVIVGFFLISKIMTYLLNKYHYQTFMAIIGFIVGSVFALFWQIKDNFIPEGNIIVIIIISVILFIAGFISSFAIARLDKQKDKVEEVEYVEDKNR